MRIVLSFFVMPVRFLLFSLFPNWALRKLHREMSLLDYVGEWREFRTVGMTRFWVSSAPGGPKLKTLHVQPFFLRTRKEGDFAGKLVIEARDGVEWVDYLPTDKKVDLELSLLRELFVSLPCLPSEKHDLGPVMSAEASQFADGEAQKGQA